MSESSLALYSKLVSQQMVTLLKKHNHWDKPISQSAIYREDSTKSGYIVAVKQEGEATKPALFTEEQVQKAIEVFDSRSKEPEIKEVVLATVRLDLDEDYEEDYFKESKSILEDKILTYYTCWDFLRLFFISFLR